MSSVSDEERTSETSNTKPIYEGLRSQCMPRQSETATAQVLRVSSKSQLAAS